MADVLILVAVLLFLGWNLMPTEMRQDFWNMLWKKDSPYD
jgi:hypothetical protein